MIRLVGRGLRIGHATRLRFTAAKIGAQRFGKAGGAILGKLGVGFLHGAIDSHIAPQSASRLDASPGIVHRPPTAGINIPAARKLQAMLP